MGARIVKPHSFIANVSPWLHGVVGEKRRKGCRDKNREHHFMDRFVPRLSDFPGPATNWKGFLAYLIVL